MSVAVLAYLCYKPFVLLNRRTIDIVVQSSVSLILLLLGLSIQLSRAACKVVYVTEVMEMILSLFVYLFIYFFTERFCAHKKHQTQNKRLLPLRSLCAQKNCCLCCFLFACFCFVSWFFVCECFYVRRILS